MKSGHVIAIGGAAAYGAVGLYMGFAGAYAGAGTAQAVKGGLLWPYYLTRNYLRNGAAAKASRIDSSGSSPAQQRTGSSSPVATAHPINAAGGSISGLGLQGRDLAGMDGAATTSAHATIGGSPLVIPHPPVMAPHPTVPPRNPPPAPPRFPH